MTDEISLSDANNILFQRYADMIATARSAHPDSYADDPRLSLDNLSWMCRTAIRESDSIAPDKASRWLGFIQGCLAMRDMINVDSERDITRPLFHAAARARGKTPGATLVRDGI